MIIEQCDDFIVINMSYLSTQHPGDHHHHHIHHSHHHHHSHQYDQPGQPPDGGATLQADWQEHSLQHQVRLIIKKHHQTE